MQSFPRKITDDSWTPHWPVSSSNASFILIALTTWADSEGYCLATQPAIAAFANCCVETARKGIALLAGANCVAVERIQRDGQGAFGMSRYQLNLGDKRVAAIFERYGVRNGDRFDAAQGKPRRQEYSVTSKKPNPESSRLPQDSGPRPYKDSRARPGASQSFIFHSIPDNHGMDDDELAEQVAEVLASCGEGTAGVETEWLMESLAYHIPLALEKGFSFEKDILPCIRWYTRYKRAKPLNRFDITFREDLPKWRSNRLLKKARCQEEKGAINSSTSSYASEPSRNAPHADQLDRYIQRRASSDESGRRAESVVRYERVIAAFDSGQETQISSLKFELPQTQRDLSGAALVEALHPIIEGYRAELTRLLT